jgi:hypothetical protein
MEHLMTCIPFLNVFLATERQAEFIQITTSISTQQLYFELYDETPLNLGSTVNCLFYQDSLKQCQKYIRRYGSYWTHSGWLKGGWEFLTDHIRDDLKAAGNF